MSAYLVSKLDIDVLVTLAVFGPLERPAEHEWRFGWTRRGAMGGRLEHFWVQRSNADELGTLLWQTNADAVDEKLDDVLPYVFTPTPRALTVTEGLQAISHYGYQTGDRPENPRWPDVEAFSDALRRHLTSYLPGRSDAPWGWSEADFDSRLDRPRPGEAGPPAPDDGADAVLAVLAASGLECSSRTKPFVLTVPDRFTVDDPWRAIGHWEALAREASTFMMVSLHEDEAGAHAAYLGMRAAVENGMAFPASHARIERFGRVVVKARVHAHTTLFTTALNALAQELGPPTEAWRSDAPLDDTLAVDVAARSIRLPRAHQVASLVRSTAGVSEALASFPDAAAIGADLGTVDFERQSVLILHGVSDVSEPIQAGMSERAAPVGQRDLALDLRVADVSFGVATVLVIDRPPTRPTTVILRTGRDRQPFVFAVSRPSSADE